MQRLRLLSNLKEKRRDLNNLQEIKIPAMRVELGKNERLIVTMMRLVLKEANRKKGKIGDGEFQWKIINRWVLLCKPIGINELHKLELMWAWEPISN